jgi:hypothetical protein
MTNKKLTQEELEKADAQRDELLMNEDSILEGMMAAVEYIQETKTVEIKRAGKLLFTFDIHGISEETLYKCRKQSRILGENPAGKRFPKVEIDVNLAKMRDLKIYEATTEDSRKKTWDNPAIQKKVCTLNGWEVIESVLMAGEKDAVCDLIDEMSGFGIDKEDYIKNSSQQAEKSI